MRCTHVESPHLKHPNEIALIRGYNIGFNGNWTGNYHQNAFLSESKFTGIKWAIPGEKKCPVVFEICTLVLSLGSTIYGF